MKILITGGAGFIGSNLTHYLLNKNHEIFTIDNFLTSNKKNIDLFKNNQYFHFYQEDVINFNFNRLPQMDIIYHLASPASPVQYKKYPIETLMVNSLGTKKILDFMIETNSKTLILASTSEVYGDPKIHPQKESYWGNVNPVGLRSCYDEAKRFSEALVITYFNKYKIDVRIARIFNTYGPNMEKNDGRVISNFICQSLSNKSLTVYGDGKQTRSFCYITDMIKALYLFAYKNKLDGQILNLGNPDEKKIIDIAKLIMELVKTDSKIKYLTIGLDDPKKRKPDITKAKKLLGWQPEVNLKDGLKLTINYFKQRFF